MALKIILIIACLFLFWLNRGYKRIIVALASELEKRNIQVPKQNFPSTLGGVVPDSIKH